jgi:hypothetical protein
LKEFLEQSNRSYIHCSAILGNMAISPEPVSMTVVASVEEALSELSARQYACVICCYDTSKDFDESVEESTVGTTTIALLQQIRGTVGGAAVLVFGSDRNWKKRRQITTRLGARCYTYRYFELLQELSTVLHQQSLI